MICSKLKSARCVFMIIRVLKHLLRMLKLIHRVLKVCLRTLCERVSHTMEEITALTKNLRDAYL